MLTREELQAERAASIARQEARRAAEPQYAPNPYERKRFGNFDGLGRKPASWYDDLFVPPMDVTEVLW